MKSLFDLEVQQEILERIDNLSESKKPLWGKMNSSQMLYHCQCPLQIALGKKDYGLKPNFFFKLLFKKSLYNDKLWRKNLPTVRQFKILDNKNYSNEKIVLIDLIQEFSTKDTTYPFPEHPAFGKFTNEQWGQMQYKHLDHHLRQFDV